MPLFGNIGPQYYDEKHQDILKKMDTFYADAITINQSFWAEADTDTRFEVGDQTIWSDVYGNLPLQNRRYFNFNRIRRIINMVSGYQRRNRKSTIVVPVENGDEVTADQFTKLIMWLNQQEGILDTVSESFHGALVTGMNLLHVWLDYRRDPISGDIKVDNCSYNSFLIDPFFKKTDLSDCRAIWKRSFVTKAEALSLLPDKREEIEGLNVGAQSGRDGKFQFMPQTYNVGYKNLLSYDEYYYRDYRKQKMLIDTQTGESMEWHSQNQDGLKEFLSFYPQVTVVEQDIPTVRLAIVLEGKVMYDGPNPLGIDHYPFVPVFAYYNPQMPYFPWRIQGMVRGLRDSQYLFNRRLQLDLDILESQLTSGWIYKENALVNPRDVFLSGQGRGLALKEEAQMTDVQKIDAPNLPPSNMQITQMLGRELLEISGVNEELMGSAVDDKAGILSMLRQGAGLTTLQKLFDQLDASQKLLGEIILELIQVNFSPGKVKRVLEEEPSPQFFNKAFGRYDAAIEEGLNTTTQKQMQFAQLLQLREVGVPIPDSVLLDAATIQNKKKLADAIMKASQEQKEAEKAQQQMNLEEMKSRINLANARATADEGLGIERVSRVQENQALAEERKAESVKDREQALLDRVRALKEIDDVDLAQVEKIIQLIQLMKAEESANEVSTYKS